MFDQNYNKVDKYSFLLDRNTMSTGIFISIHPIFQISSNIYVYELLYL